MSGQALMGRGQSAARPLLPTAARPLAVAVVMLCVLVIVAQGVWIRHGMETGWVDTVVDAKIRADLGGHHLLLAMLVWPGEAVPTTALAVVLVLACLYWRRFGEAALVAISVPLAAAVTDLVLKPLIGRTSWGDPFPSGHITSVVALATALSLLLATTPAGMPRRLRLVLALTGFLAAAAVAFGVIGANMHHFTDTIGGAAVGAGTVLLTALLFDRLSRRHAQHRDDGRAACR
jgi:membrane-associated phospholipid phosphatase